MKRIVLVFGVLSGVVSSAMMFLTMPLIKRGVVNFSNGEVIGYTAIFLSFLFVFFGIRSYREHLGGTISFWRGFGAGLLMTVISCAFYVASWEIIYFKMMPDFGDRYANAIVASMREKGASETAIAAKKREIAEMKAMLDNPVTNAAVTFLEPFVIGFPVALISAAVLRRKPRGGFATATA